jgi:hypothetical protein
MTHIKSSHHTLSLHRMTAHNSQLTNFPRLSPTENSPRTTTRALASVSHSCKPLIWNAGNAPSIGASIVASLLKRVTSLLTWSRDPSPLLRHPSHYSCCLTTNEARRCEAMWLVMTWQTSARHSTEKTPLRQLLRNCGNMFRRYSSCMA